MRFLLLILSIILSASFSKPVSAQITVIDSLKKELAAAKNDTSKVALLNELGSKNEFSDPAAALSYINQSVEIAKKANFIFGLANAYRIAGVLSVDKNDFEGGLKYYSKADSLYKTDTSFRFRRGRSLIVFNTGVIDFYKEEYYNAIDKFIISAKKFEELNDAGQLFNAYNNLSVVYGFLLEKENALKYARLAKELSDKTGDKNKQAQCYSQLGSALYELKQCDSVGYFAEKAIAFATETNNAISISNGYNILGAFFMDCKKDPQKGYDNYVMAKSFAEKGGSLYNVTAINQNIGNCLLRLNRLAEAEKYLKASIEGAKKFGVKQIEMYATKNLAELEQRRNNFKISNQYWNESIILMDSVFTSTNKIQVKQLEVRYQSEKKQSQITQLEKEKELQSLSIRQKNTFNALLGIGLLAAGIIGFLYYRNAKRKQQLARQTSEIKDIRIKELEQEKQLVAINSILQGQEAERSRMAKDLHDGLGGILSGIKLNLSSMKGNMIIEQTDAQLFAKSIGQLDSAIAEMRRVAHNMMPEALLKFGLGEAIQDYCDGINESNIVRMKYTQIGLQQPLEKSTEIALYRIIQELSNNAIKHATAKNIFIQVAKHERGITLTVEDDGKGFEVSQLESMKGAGLSNVQARVDYLKGMFTIESAAGKGTVANVEVPL